MIGTKCSLKRDERVTISEARRYLLNTMIKLFEQSKPKRLTLCLNWKIRH